MGESENGGQIKMIQRSEGVVFTGQKWKVSFWRRYYISEKTSYISLRSFVSVIKTEISNIYRCNWDYYASLTRKVYTVNMIGISVGDIPQQKLS